MMLKKACQANCKSMIIKMVCPEAEFLDVLHTKVLRVFLLAIRSHLFSFAWRFKFLQVHATSDSFCSVYTVKEKGGNLTGNHTPIPYDLRNPYRNLKSENSHDYTQKSQRKIVRS